MMKWVAVLLLGAVMAACGGSKKGAAAPDKGAETAAPTETSAPAASGEAAPAGTEAPAVPPAK